MHNRRVLIIALRFPPAATASVFRTLRFVKYLPDFGWEPMVLAADLPPDEAGPGADLLRQVPSTLIVDRTRPWSLFHRRNGLHSPTTHEARGANGARNDGRQTNGADAAASTRDPSGASVCRSLKRLPRTVWRFASQTPDNYVWWVPPALRAGLKLVRKHRPHVLYTSGPPHSTHLIGYWLKRMTGLPWLADFRDPWARKPWGSKSTNPWGEHFDQRFERLCVRTADRVVLNTPRMAQEFQSYYSGDAAIDASKFLAIPNGCDPDLAETVDRLLAQSPTANINGTSNHTSLRLCHPGSLYRRRDPRPLIDALARLSQQGMHVRFEQIGHCDPSFHLSSYAEARGLGGRVTIEPPIPHADVLRRMAAADLLLLIQPGTSIQIPGKLFEMLPFRKPILGLTDEGAAADVLQDFGLGAMAASDDPQAIASALKTLVERGHNNRQHRRWDEAMSAFDGKELTGRLAAALDSTLSTPCEVTT